MAKKKKGRQGYRSPGPRSSGGMGGGNMMAQLQQMQEQMAATQQQLADETVEGAFIYGQAVKGTHAVTGSQLDGVSL